MPEFKKVVRFRYNDEDVAFRKRVAILTTDQVYYNIQNFVTKESIKEILVDKNKDFINILINFAYTKKDSDLLFSLDESNSFIAAIVRYPNNFMYLKSILDIRNMKNNEKEFIFNLLNLNSTSFYSYQINSYNYYKLCGMDTTLVSIMCDKIDYDNLNKNIYKKFKITQASGKVREIIAPCNEFKKNLKILNKYFQEMYDKRNINFQVGYKKGKSVKSNAILHKDQNYMFNIDLKNFFPSCKKDLVKKYIYPLFRDCINKDYFIELFLSIILYNDALYIGNPISGTLANAIISKPVAYINNICNKHNINFSVYADDMCFSSDKFIDKKFVTAIFNEAFDFYNLSSYFALNHKKLIAYTGSNRRVTGVIINNENKISSKRSMRRLIRSGLNHLEKGDFKWNFNELKGRISYTMMLDETDYMLNLINKYENTILKYKLLNKEQINKYRKMKNK